MVLYGSLADKAAIIMRRIYGRRPVEEFLKKKPDRSLIRHIYVSKTIPKKYIAILEPLIRGLKNTLSYHSRPELDRLCDGNHQGIIVEVTDNALSQTIQKDKDRRPDPKAPIKDALDEFPGLYVLTDRLQDAQNLGSLIRSAEALGARALIVSGKGVRPNEASDRISAGASNHLPVFTMANPDGFLRDAKEKMYWVISAAGRPDSGQIEAESDFQIDNTYFEYGDEAEPYEIEIGLEINDNKPFHDSRSPVYLSTNQVDRLPENGRYVLIIGHEGEGIKRSLIQKSDFVMSIPLQGKVSSLNAAVAAAILIERILSFAPNPEYEQEA